MVSFQQVDYVNGPDKKPIVDFLGRFEQLEQDFEQLKARLGISKALPRFNESDHLPYTTYYDTELIDWVSRHFRQDLEQFGYRFQ